MQIKRLWHSFDIHDIISPQELVRHVPCIATWVLKPRGKLRLTGLRRKPFFKSYTVPHRGSSKDLVLFFLMEKIEESGVPARRECEINPNKSAADAFLVSRLFRRRKVFYSSGCHSYFRGLVAGSLARFWMEVELQMQLEQEWSGNIGSSWTFYLFLETAGTWISLTCYVIEYIIGRHMQEWIDHFDTTNWKESGWVIWSTSQIR